MNSLVSGRNEAKKSNERKNTKGLPEVWKAKGRLYGRVFGSPCAGTFNQSGDLGLLLPVVWELD